MLNCWVILSTKNVNLSIERVIVIYARVVLFTPCLIMFKDYAIILNVQIGLSTQRLIM